MSNATDTYISIAGFSTVDLEHDGRVVITDCEKQTEVDDMGEKLVTYIPNTDSWRRLNPESCGETDGSHSGIKAYTPAYNFCNDVWSLDPPTTTITGKNSFFNSKISGNLRRQMSHTQGPNIDRLGLVSVKVGELVATQAETVRKDGTVAEGSPVYATTYDFGPIPETNDYHVCQPMGIAAKGLETARRVIEKLSDKM